MKRLNLKRIITLSLCLALLISLGTKFVFADEEASKLDNFKKVQTYKEGTFTDVKENAWFHDSIKNLYELKLMIGMTDSLFDTENNLKVSEAMALAVRLNSTYEGKPLPEQGQGKKWFEPYINYIKENEIANPDDYDLNSPITRLQFAEIFSKALPEDAYKEINDVKEGMIPDVTGSMELNKAIYTLFRSGVLTGMDETRSFEPNRTIKRSEAATVVSRIVNPKERVNLGLPIVEEPVIPEVPEKETKKSSGGGSGGGGGGNPPAKDYSKEPLTFTALSDGNSIVKFCELGTMNDDITYQYKLDTDEWKDYTMGQSIQLAKGKTVSFRAKAKVEELNYGSSDFRYFVIDNDDDPSNANTSEVEVSGNIMSLLDPTLELKNLDAKKDDGTTFKYQMAFRYIFVNMAATNGLVSAKNLILPAEKLSPACYICMFYADTKLKEAPKLPAKDLTDAEYCYSRMFEGCTSLENAPELPATKLVNDCYNRMFSQCTSLKTMPNLPATELQPECYYAMFDGCSSLTQVKALPAIDLTDANGCYQYMFCDCTGLTAAPELPATKLAKSCYEYMFEGCSNLQTAPELPATKLFDNCYKEMYKGCTNLTTAPELPATKLAESCYKYMFCDCTGLTAAPELPATNLAKECYSYMFKGCSNLQTAPELPAIEIPECAYNCMFFECTSLEEAPWLPASSIGYFAYSSMFEKCTKIEKVYMNCKDLDESQDMFKGITGLTLYCPKELYDYIVEGRKTPIGIGAIIPDEVRVVVLPEKGDLITLGTDENKQYRVLKRDGLKVEVMSEDHFTSEYSWWDDYKVTIDLGGQEYIKYEDGEIDTYLKGEYYNSLDDEIKNAIIPQEVSQTVTDYTSETISDYLYKYLNPGEFFVYIADSTLPILRTVYPLGIKNVVEYLIKDDMTLNDNNLLSLTWGDENTFVNSYEADYNDSVQMLSTGGGIFSHRDEITVDVHPVFTIDLTKIDYDYYDDYFAITAVADSNVILHKEGMPSEELTLEYTKDKKVWTALTPDDPIHLETGDTVYFRNSVTLTEFSNCLDEYPYTTYYVFDTNDNNPSDGTNNASIELSGNIMSLLSPTFDVYDFTTEYVYDYVFQGLFSGNTAIIDASKLILPAKHLSEGCYESMFDGCSNLTKAPVLPSMNLADCCYDCMFMDCTSLEEAPALPATELVERCYECMFWGCTTLEESPELPATKLAPYCYNDMFDDSGLTKAPELPATELAEGCYQWMFSGCAFEKAPALPALELAKGCYESMFNSCSSLEDAPELPATELVEDCYKEMFKGCSSLKTLTIGFSEFVDNGSTTDWFANDWTNTHVVDGSQLIITCPAGSFTGFTSPVTSGSVSTFKDRTTLDRVN